MRLALVVVLTFVVGTVSLSHAQAPATPPSCQIVTANVSKYIGKTVTFTGVQVTSQIKTSLDGKRETLEIYICSDAKGQSEDFVNAFGGFALDPNASKLDADAANSETRRVTGVVKMARKVTFSINRSPTKKVIPFLTDVKMSLP